MMTAKQRVALVAAQYAKLARDMTRQGDSIADMAKVLSEDAAQKVFDELVRLELVDRDGVLTTTPPRGLGEWAAKVKGVS